MEIFVLLCCASKFCDAQSNTLLSNKGGSLSVQTFVEDVFISKYDSDKVIFKTKIKNKSTDTAFIRSGELYSAVIDSSILEKSDRIFSTSGLKLLYNYKVDNSFRFTPYIMKIKPPGKKEKKYNTWLKELNSGVAYKMLLGDSTDFYQPVKYYYIPPEDSTELYTTVHISYYDYLKLDSIYREDNVKDIAEATLIYDYKTSRNSEDKGLPISLNRSMIETFFRKFSGKSSK